MSIQNLIPAASLLAPNPVPYRQQGVQTAPGADSAAASFSRMLAQARQGSPAPAPAPVAAPAPSPAPPASAAPKAAPPAAPEDAPVKAGPGTDSQNLATTEPVQPTDEGGGTAADTRKPPERSARGATARASAARTERPAAGDDAAAAHPADKAAEDGPAGAVPLPWQAAPPADAALAGLSRANQTTPVPSTDASDDSAQGAGTGQGIRSPAAGDVRDARKPGDAAQAGERVAQRAAGEQSFAGALAAAAEPKHAAAAEPLPVPGEASGAAAAGAAAPAAATSASDTPAPVQASLATPVTSPEFREALGVQVSVLAKDGVEHAELQLNPSDMGPISVRISMEGDQARVDFGADLARTRDVIQAGWAELATSLQDAGFTLSGGGVSQHSAGRNGADDSGGAGTRGGTGARNIAPPDELAIARAPRTTVRAGGVDLFA